MARELTEIEIKIIDGATKALNSIAASAKSGKTTFTELSSAVVLVENALGKIASVGNFAVGLLQPARDVETALAAVKAVTGATAEEFALLKAAAEKAGTSTKFSTAEAAGGLAELARAGFTATQAIDALNPSLNLAQGNAIGVSEAATILTTSLVQFGLSSDQAGRASDILQKTADATATSVTEVGNAMSYAAPAAKALGFSIEETASAIGILANNGLRGERAGTVLRDVFTQLLLPTSQLSKLFKESGIEVTSFSGFLKALGDDAALANKAFAILGVSGAGLRPIVEDAGKSVSAFTTVLQGAAGTAQATADVMGKTFDNALLRLSNTFDQAKASFLEPLLQPLAEEFDFVADKIKAFTQTQDFEILKGHVLDFVNNTIEQLNRVGADFDSQKALDGIKQFVIDVRIQFAGLAEAAKNTKTILDRFGVALNGAQSIGARIKGTFAEVGVILGELDQKIQGVTDANAGFIKTFDGIAQSAANAAKIQDLEFAAAIEALQGVVGPATIELRQLLEAQYAQEAAALASASATRAAAEATDEAAAAAPAAAGAVLNVAKSLTAGATEAGKFGERVVTAVGASTPAIDALRAKLVTLQASLKKAFEAGDENALKEIGNEIRVTTEELEKLTGATKPAASAVDDLGERAQTAAPKVQELASSSGRAAVKAKELADSTDETSGSLLNLTGAGQAAVTIIEGVSEKFAQLQQQQQQSGAVGDQLIAENLRRGLEAQRQQVGLALKSLDDYDAAVESRLKQLRNKYDLIDDEILRKLAEKQVAADKASAQRAADAPPSVRNGGGASPGGIGSGAPVFNITLQSLSPGDLSNSTISDLARRLAGPIRTYYQSGA